MVSIVQRGKSWAVVYYYKDISGERKQKWEYYHTLEEALSRKAEVERKQKLGTFVVPNNVTVAE